MDDRHQVMAMAPMEIQSRESWELYINIIILKCDIKIHLKPMTNPFTMALHWTDHIMYNNDKKNKSRYFTKNKVFQQLAAGRWFSMGTLFSSTNKTDSLDITEILLKVVLNTITITHKHVLYKGVYVRLNKIT
jgi:hypothetical protein